MRNIITLLISFTTLIGYSQSENGEVIYSIKIKKNSSISQKFDSVSLKNSKTKDGEAINKIMKSAKKSLSNLDDVEFKLLFNKHESYYTYEEKMDIDNSELSNMLRNIFIESGRKYSYNSKTKTVSKQTEFDGKKYIIKTHSDSLKWKLINTKKKLMVILVTKQLLSYIKNTLLVLKKFRSLLGIHQI